MSDNMLDKGITSQGMMHRGYDKYGKRVHMAEPKEAGRPESQMPAKNLGGGEAVGPRGNDSDTKRKDNGTY